MSHTDQEIKDANVEISKLVKEAYKAISKAEGVAEEFGLDFSLSVAYGMGGTYYSEGQYRKENDIPEEEEVESENSYGESNFGWMASSQGC